MAAASVFAACRCDGKSRLLDDVVPVAQVGESHVENAYRVLDQELGLPTKPMRPKWFVPRLASELSCTDVVRRRAQALAERADAAGDTSGVHPAGFAAACLYKAACEYDRPLTQVDAATAAGVTIETVRAHRETLVAIEL